MLQKIVLHESGMTRSCLVAAREQRHGRGKAKRVQWRDHAKVPGLLAEFAVETSTLRELPERLQRPNSRQQAAKTEFTTAGSACTATTATRTGQWHTEISRVEIRRSHVIRKIVLLSFICAQSFSRNVLIQHRHCNKH